MYYQLLGFFEEEKKKRKALSKNQKERIARGQDWKCGRCQEKIEPLGFDIHHRDKDSSNNDIANLVAYCVKCHRIVTQKQNKENSKKQDKYSGLTGNNQKDYSGLTGANSARMLWRD